MSISPNLTRNLHLQAVVSDFTLISRLQEVNAQIKASIKNMRCLAAVAPFAAVSGSTNTFILITRAVGSFIKVTQLWIRLQTSTAKPSPVFVCWSASMVVHLRCVSLENCFWAFD